jgi:hypothetical protein
MARTPKQGIQYFSHDVDMLGDKKIKLIKAKHKLLGYAIYLRLLEELYMDKGYYLVADDDFNILFADDNNLDYDVYMNVLNDCIKYELFDKNLYEKYGILTSLRVQKNYLEATVRRKSVEIIGEYVLFKVNDDISNDNVYISKLYANIGTQSKVNRKGKEIEKESNTPKGFDYNGLFDYYISVNLIKHTKLTSSMKKSIDLARKDYSLEEMKTQIDRHVIITKASKGSEFPVPIRGLGVFFGQKAYKATHLICSEYADDGAKWLRYQDGGYDQPKELGKTLPQMTPDEDMPAFLRGE